MSKEFDAIFDTIGQILKEERQRTSADLDDTTKTLSSEIETLANRIKSLDGNLLIKGAAQAVASANLAALREHAENVLLRKSVHVEGDLPPLAKGMQR